MKNAILIRYSEIFLKGKNKNYFEGVLINNIKNKLKNFKFSLIKAMGRIIINNYAQETEYEIVEELKKIFGIHSISVATEIESTENAIKKYISSLKFDCKTFKVNVKRAYKNFPIPSNEFAPLIGEVVLKSNKNLLVDVHNPELTINIDIRQPNKTYVFYEIIPGLGGLPVGVSGSGLLLLSGGIDSPVAGYLIAKRGMLLNAVHFYSHPYTSLQAKQKVVDLANLISDYTGKIKLHFVKFTKVQEAIHSNCKPEYMITIMRRIMMRISEIIANNNNLKAIITGENLGQVASQTIESLTSTNNVLSVVPVLRPLIAMDKEEIISIAKKINTFNTSILPFDDCCTVFLPDHPLIKPNIKKVEIEEKKMDLDKLISEALNEIEVMEI